jgi:hypothetical protein
MPWHKFSTVSALNFLFLDSLRKSCPAMMRHEFSKVSALFFS